jgi:hypothetical protein
VAVAHVPRSGITQRGRGVAGGGSARLRSLNSRRSGQPSEQTSPKRVMRLSSASCTILAVKVF